MKSRRSAPANIIADHTGNAGLETFSIRIGPGPAIEWPITKQVNQPVLVQAINIRVVEGLVFSPNDPQLPAVGVGWASLTGQPDNCIYVTNPLQKGNPLTYAEVISNTSGTGLGRLSSPPVADDHLVLRLGEWIDLDEVDELAVASGLVMVQVRFHMFDDWGDLAPL